MFGRKKAIKGKELEQLEQRIKTIESALVEIANMSNGRRPEPEGQSQSQAQSQPQPQSQPKKADYTDNQEIQAALRRIELEEQTVAEIRSALQEKLKEIEEKSLQFEKEQQAAREAFQRELDLERWAFQREMEEKRAQLDRELEQRREEEMGALQGRVDRVWKNYNLYLSRLHGEAERLTEAALYAGRAVIENKDADIDALFQERLNGPRPTEEPAAAEVTPPEEAVPVAEEVTLPEKEAVPAAEEVTPPAGEMVWGVEEAAPPEEAVPAAREVTPPAGKMVWAAEDMAPPEEETVPTAEDMAPSDVDIPFIMREGVPAK